ncbi:sugar-binding protein [Fervidibacillus halotolerans]|uniref:Sugar-binding protein n=1 Tax=Fervidibacillus halotolerans TaxID=2980027 RepID=A0A9E8RY65_9BACI|nr:sugar-binding protein [Fervidibacillus halotolerans]WAA12526.1 sugar-binding protein [Fervidibacillus halotolerans]
MKNRIYLMIILLFFVSLFFVVYYGKETFLVNKTVNKEQKEYTYHFVLIPEEEDNEYWRTVEKGARDAAKKYRVYLEYIGPSRANMEEHVQVLDKVIAGKVDGIMVQGIADVQFTPLINKAINKGISVVTVDTDLPESEREAYIGTDNYLAGYIAGKALIEDTIGPQQVGVVIGRKDAEHQQLRVDGFKDAIEEEERIEIVGIKESKISKTGAVQATYDLLKENPDITAFYGTSALDGIGISQVIRTLKPNLDPYIIAFDTLPETLKLLKKGEIDALVVQHPYEMGYRSVETLIHIKEGNHPEKLQYTETGIWRIEDLIQQKGTYSNEDDPE